MGSFFDDIGGFLQGAINPVQGFIKGVSSSDPIAALTGTAGLVGDVAGLPAADVSGVGPGVGGAFTGEAGGAGDLIASGDIAAGSDAFTGLPGAALTSPGGGIDIGAVPEPVPAGAPGTINLSGIPSLPGGDVSGGAILTPPPTGGATDTGGFLSFLRRTIERNPMLALGAAGLGANLLARPSVPRDVKAARAAAQAEGPLASKAASEGEQLISAARTGQLPAGLEQMVQNQIESAKAQIISAANARGQSVNDSAVQQDLANVDRQAIALRAQIAEQVGNFGLQELQTAGTLTSDESQLLANLGQIQLSLDQGLQQAIAEFAAALGLGAGAEAAKLAA